MEYKEILLRLELIEDGLVDAYNTGHEGEINSDSLYYIDCGYVDSARCTLYELKEKLEKLNESS